MTNEAFEEILGILDQWSSVGERSTEMGARLSCPTPFVAPEAWFHVTFAGLSPDAIKQLALRSQTRLPTEFTDFLRLTNGAFLFSHHISVWGSRRNYVRTGDDAWQPHDLADHNQANIRPPYSPEGVIYFGTDDRRRSLCFFEPS